MTSKKEPYSVTYWMTHPSLNNDDCNTGSDYETLEQAVEAFNTPDWEDGNYIEINGPDIYEVKMKPDHDPKAYAERKAKEEERERREWQRENAMQEGMGRGVQGWNEAMGYDVEPYQPPLDDDEREASYGRFDD